MSTSRVIFAAVLGVLFASSAFAGPLVPFKGTWAGVTSTADLSEFPLVAVVSDGGGPTTHLGGGTMVSPHMNNVFTGEVWGEQIFTAANGDTLTAWCEGQGVPLEDGSVDGLLDCTFTSGTGRFEGVYGNYTFHFLAVPRTDGGPGYVTSARVKGLISSVGASKR